jgi:hypothetical protein
MSDSRVPSDSSRTPEWGSPELERVAQALRELREERDRYRDEYALRARAAVIVLMAHDLEGEYLAKYEELKADV